MAPKHRLGPENDRRHLAAMIDTEMNRGQRPDGANGEPWTNKDFGLEAAAAETTVRGWRGADGAALATPNGIVPILKAFYGPEATTAFPCQYAAMKSAWRRAKGYLDDEPAAPEPRALDHKVFTGPLNLVDLTVSQPTPDNAGNLIVPYTLHIYPDTTRAYRGQCVEIGLTAACVKVAAQAWQPNEGTVFRHKTHANVRGTAAKHAIDAIGPLDTKGRLAGLAVELPSEARWEYACRAGTETPYSFGETISREQACFGGRAPVQVGSLPANAWGLREMHGNVWEWCEDTWHNDYQDAPLDGTARVKSKRAARRVLRGGSWIFGARFVRSASRDFHAPSGRNVNIGFRCARVQAPSDRTQAAPVALA